MQVKVYISMPFPLRISNPLSSQKTVYPMRKWYTVISHSSQLKFVGFNGDQISDSCFSLHSHPMKVTDEKLHLIKWTVRQPKNISDLACYSTFHRLNFLTKFDILIGVRLLIGKNFAHIRFMQKVMKIISQIISISYLKQI